MPLAVTAFMADGVDRVLVEGLLKLAEIFHRNIGVHNQSLFKIVQVLYLRLFYHLLQKWTFFFLFLQKI